jgi:hypothetical protein
MIKLCYRCRGSISLFLVLIMLPMFILAGLVIDGSRISVAKTEVSGAGDLAMNAALSDYNQYLQEVYGLFAMSESLEDLESNVERYFQNTIDNSGVLDSGDSYTRSFINSIGSWFDEGGMDFDNIVKMEVESFGLVEVPDSAIGQPDVLERQIVEYMKYRGPVNIAKGLLTKLGCLGDTNNQTKALAAKVDYDQKLDTVAKSCKNAYEKIINYNNEINGNPYSESSDDSKSGINTAVTSAKANYSNMVKYIVAWNSADNFSADEFEKDEDYYNQIKNQLSSDDTEEEKLEYIENKLEAYVKVKEKSDGGFELGTTSFKSTIDELDYEVSDDLETCINYVKDWNDCSEKANKTYALIQLYYDSCGDWPTTDCEDKYNAFVSFRNTMSSVQSRAAECINRDAWYSKAEEYRSAGNAELNKWYTPLDNIILYLEEACNLLDKVLGDVSELSISRQTWGNKIEALQEGEIRAGLQGDYEASAKDINQDAINALKISLDTWKKCFEQIKDRLKNNTFYDFQIVENSGLNDYVNKINQEEGSYSDIVSTSNNIISSHYSEKDVNGINPEFYKKADNSEQFFKYLQATCGTIDSTKKEQAKNDKKTLVQKGDDSTAQTADTTGVNTNTISSTIGTVNEALNTLAQGASEGASRYESVASAADGEDKEIAESGKQNLNKVGDMLSGLATVVESLAREGRDDIYIEEYITEMFSCYTSMYDASGNVKADVLAMNGKSMTDNAFYRSEVEYVLFGDDSVAANLNYAKSLIFGIRFALNSVYAFTNIVLRNYTLATATAIAGWTGFGVPIVQTVLTIALAMGESVLDIQELCSGKEVVLYKQNTTWRLSPTGIAQYLTNQAVDSMEERVDDVFEKISGTAENAINECASSIATFADHTIIGIQDTIVSNVVTPLQGQILSIVSSSDAGVTVESIKNTLSLSLDSLIATACSGDDIVSQATSDAITYVKDSVLDGLSEDVYNVYSEYQNGLISDVNTIADEVTSKLESTADLVKIKISSSLDSWKNNLIAETNTIISEAGDTVKEELVAKLEEKTALLSKSPNSSQEKDKTSSGVAIMMTYKEYLKVFTLLRLITPGNSEDAMLCRIAKLIQANANSKSEELDISKSYTMVQINAKVNVGTTFFDIPSAHTEAGNTTYDLNYSNIGSGKQSIRYVGINGY